MVEAGDKVRDPMDGSIRQVADVREDTVFMEDGGCMGLAECTEVYLPSEIIPRLETTGRNLVADIAANWKD